MRRRSLRTQLILGAVLALMVLIAVPVVFFSARDGIDAVQAGDASTAIEQMLIALVAAAFPVIAASAYAHWLWVTSRPRPPHQPHVPSRTEQVLVAAVVAVLAIAAWPIGSLSAQESMDAFEASRLTSGVLYALLGLTYAAFAVFCLVRFVRWVR
jgi:heme/copper-type cytochrome/quinol oxidase subunit 2